MTCNKGAIMKQKLSIDELITHMKNKGIKFDIVSAQDARKSLTYNNCKCQWKSEPRDYEFLSHHNHEKVS